MSAEPQISALKGLKGPLFGLADMQNVRRAGQCRQLANF
jgi:hypothetical protein